jgi:hypothetical protein
MKLHYKKIFLFLSILAVNGLLFYMLSHSSVRTRPFGDGDFHEETKVLTQYLWGNVDYNYVSVTKAPGRYCTTSPLTCCQAATPRKIPTGYFP